MANFFYSGRIELILAYDNNKKIILSQAPANYFQLEEIAEQKTNLRNVQWLFYCQDKQQGNQMIKITNDINLHRVYQNAEDFIQIFVNYENPEFIQFPSNLLDNQLSLSQKINQEGKNIGTSSKVNQEILFRMQNEQQKEIQQQSQPRNSLGQNQSNQNFVLEALNIENRNLVIDSEQKYQKTMQNHQQYEKNNTINNKVVEHQRSLQSSFESKQLQDQKNNQSGKNFQHLEEIFKKKMALISQELDQIDQKFDRIKNLEPKQTQKFDLNYHFNVLSDKFAQNQQEMFFKNLAENANDESTSQQDYLKLDQIQQQNSQISQSMQFGIQQIPHINNQNLSYEAQIQSIQKQEIANIFPGSYINFTIVIRNNSFQD